MKNNLKKNIGLFLDDSRISGISIYTMHLANFISNRLKIPCEIILSKKNSNDYIKLLKKKKIFYKFYKIERISRNTILNYFLFFFFKRKTLFNFYNKNIYNIYIIQGSLQFLNHIVCNSLKKNTVMIVHDAFTNWYFKFILKIVVNKKTKIIFVSKRSYNFYKNTFSKNLKIIIPNGVINKKKIRKKNKTKFLKIGTSCNVNPDKNIGFLIKVARILKKENLDIVFLIAGNIYNSQLKYFKSLKEIIKKENLNNIKFLGYKKDINNFLKNLNLYCCFSERESSPLSIWEAMHFGLPIITTDVGDLKYHLNKGKFGYLIKNFDENVYANKIKKILNNKNIYEKFSNASFNYSQKVFNQDNNFRKALKFIFSNKKFIDNKKIKLSTGNLNLGKP
jgi:glycosyltransferase involved in cell wall biosynthesis